MFMVCEGVQFLYFRERPSSAPRSTSVSTRYDDTRLSCSPSNLTRFELPTTSSALSSSNSSNTSVPSTDLLSNPFKAELNLGIKASKSATTESTSNQQAGPSTGVDSECVICMNDKVNCVLYRCGHMCLCIKCARETMDVNGICPICRQIIMDVIKIYHA